MCYNVAMSLNDRVGSPCKLTAEWGFEGFLEDGTRIPIGVYGRYCDGTAHANSWMKNTPKAERWEGTRLYEEIADE